MAQRARYVTIFPKHKRNFTPNLALAETTSHAQVWHFLAEAAKNGWIKLRNLVTEIFGKVDAGTAAAVGSHNCTLSASVG